jgi:hypothetical protein
MDQSGCYIYRVDGVTMAREPWVVTSGAGETVRVSAKREAQDFGVSLTLEAVTHENGSFDYQLELRSMLNDAILKSACYSLSANGIHARIGQDATFKLLSPSTAHVFPLMRYFTKDMVSAILQRGGQHDVIVPDIRNMQDMAALFAPLQSVRTVSRVASDPRAFDLSGGSYEAPVRLYLNDEGLLAHYEFKDTMGKVWTCDLEA